MMALLRLCPSCSAHLLTLARCTCGASRSARPSLPGHHWLHTPPKNVVVVHKTSRLQYEMDRSSKLSEDQTDGNTYPQLLQRHTAHQESLQEITSSLSSHGVIARLRNRDSYSCEDVQWADVIIAAGGDGNFLFTASKVLSPDKLVVGINTDPCRSEGFLCVRPSPGMVGVVLEQVFKEELPIIQKQRIRVSIGSSLLPVRALNEVFVGEKDLSHASSYELCHDNHPPERQKSSGLLIYTGTGSTSWAYNVNKFTTHEVQRLLAIAQNEGVAIHPPARSSVEEVVCRVTELYNSSNVFSGEEQQMAFCVREPIVRGIFAAQETHGYARSLSVQAYSWGTQLVLDGHTYQDLPYGDVASCQLHPLDTLKTIDVQRTETETR